MNLMDENNTNLSQIIQIMSNQESTLRRLIFESDSRTRSVYNPIFTSLPSQLPRSTTTTGIRTYGLERFNTANSLNNIDNALDRFFENVNVTPTQQQINNALNNCLYSSIDDPLNVSCPISLRRFEDNDEVSVIRYCNHIFCRNDLENWFRSNTRCPLCRYDIRNYTPRQHQD